MTRLRPLRILLLRLAVVALIFTLQRLLFAVLNHQELPSPPLAAFIGGIRFDLSAMAWLYIPWLLASLFNDAPGMALRRVQHFLFHLSNVFCFFLNSVDLEYFKFTLKRSTSDLFGIAAGGGDLAHLAPVFLADYWYVALVFLASMALAEWGYRRAGRPVAAERARPWWAWRLVAIGLIVLSSRGGLQYIPLGVLDAAKYAPPEYMPLVLNTPFTFMTSLGKPGLEEKHYMSANEAERLWPVQHQYGDSALLPPRTNVVVLIMESFSAAYSARLNPGREGYMPFLDSLMGVGLYYNRAYANGRRSIDGIPAVLASLPKMMPGAFTESPYAQQQITALPGLLANEGYSTSFFHGGHNGTMGFDAFARTAGFARYVGRDQYPHAGDNDGTWGIRDRPFLQFFAQQLAQEKEPFMSCLFTLSTHHPYKLPPGEAEQFAGGELPIMPTLRYADDALRDFFRTARTMPWFQRTLFVITADHTADLLREGETSGSAYDHWVPLLYYAPGSALQGESSQVTQQIDILPTVLDLIGHPHPFFAFGSSSLRHERTPAAVSESNATWLLVTGKCQMRSDGMGVLWSAPTTPGDSCADAAEQLPLLQAAVQQFNNHMRHGQLLLSR